MVRGVPLTSRCSGLRRSVVLSRFSTSPPRSVYIPVVISSALDSAVGICAGLVAAGALPRLDLACGLGTGGLFVDDVVESLDVVEGALDVVGIEPDAARLSALAALPPADWWIARIRPATRTCRRRAQTNVQVQRSHRREPMTRSVSCFTRDSPRWTLVGPYEALRWLPDAEIRFRGPPGPVTADLVR